MLTTIPRQRLARPERREFSDELERGRIVFFPECPIPLPSEEDLVFLRGDLTKHLKRKNVSYHPEAGRIVGMKGPAALRQRAREILTAHSARVRSFLEQIMPDLTRDWEVGTTSFRPIQEKGRNLSTHASNERVHVDAGAYGATHGDRILRFFVNVNPREDRVWVTKGSFPDLFRRYASASGVASIPATARVTDGMAGRVYTGMIRGVASLGLRPLRLLDTSAYDRTMRRFHNFLKESREVQETPEGHEQISFPPFSAWMVFTDGVSHACISGQHALVDTFVIRLRNCRYAEMTPFHILRNR